MMHYFLRGFMKFLFILMAVVFNFQNVFAIDNEDTWFKLAEQKSNPQYRMQDCPIVGNLDSGLYHMPHQKNYKQMLYKNKCVVTGKCRDNRKCFESEDQAKAAYVVACPLDTNGEVEKCRAGERVSRLFVKARN